MKCFDQIKQHEAYKRQTPKMLELAELCSEMEESLIHSVLNLLSNQTFEFGSDYGGMNLSTRRVLVVLLVQHVISLKVVDVDDEDEDDDSEDDDGASQDF